MNTVLLWLLIGALGVGIVWWLTKKGKIADRDGDNIPDVIEDAVDVVKHRTKRVAEELNDVVDATVDVAKQTADIAGAVKGKPRKGRKPATDKASTPKKTTAAKKTTTKSTRSKKSGGGANSSDSKNLDTKI